MNMHPNDQVIVFAVELLNPFCPLFRDVDSMAWFNVLYPPVDMLNLEILISRNGRVISIGTVLFNRKGIPKFFGFDSLLRSIGYVKERRGMGIDCLAVDYFQPGDSVVIRDDLSNGMRPLGDILFQEFLDSSEMEQALWVTWNGLFRCFCRAMEVDANGKRDFFKALQGRGESKWSPFVDDFHSQWNIRRSILLCDVRARYFGENALPFSFPCEPFHWM